VNCYGHGHLVGKSPINVTVPDVLFTDIRLPGELDGWRLAAMAHEAKPGLPVIYVTGYNVNRDAAVPGSVFLKKPYRASAITEIIRTLIGPNPTAAGTALHPAQGTAMAPDRRNATTSIGDTALWPISLP